MPTVGSKSLVLMELSSLVIGLKSFALLLIDPSLPCSSYMLTHSWAGTSAALGYVAEADHEPFDSAEFPDPVSVQLEAVLIVSPE